ncbi:MAG: hypothetical protein DWQ19_12765 [Crenarchaeota archaeon]|nr:MAG: hypothetical protein DWQ19_12765 [Thermoproteota archaeon]
MIRRIEQELAEILETGQTLSWDKTKKCFVINMDSVPFVKGKSLRDVVDKHKKITEAWGKCTDEVKAIAKQFGVSNVSSTSWRAKAYNWNEEREKQEAFGIHEAREAREARKARLEARKARLKTSPSENYWPNFNERITGVCNITHCNGEKLQRKDSSK